MTTKSNASLAPLSWDAVDRNYANRTGYARDFLPIRVAVPSLSKALLRQANIPVLKYEHFSILLNPRRKLAHWTAVNIDGAQNRNRGYRDRDAWWVDDRDDGRYKQSQTNNAFYRNSGFQRGHLVRRLDPAWGEDDAEAGRAEADSFHFTNCSPQVPKLNTDWWAKVEDHVLGTANATEQRISVFSGCLFGDSDPMYRSLPIPLAFWKVVAWTVGKRNPQLRSLGFFVKQDEAVAQLLRRRSVQPLAVDLGDVPDHIQGYQVTVEELARKTQISFGQLARKSVDVYAMKRAKRLSPLAFDDVDVYRRLRKPSDLITE